jgi:hypothetical protein
MNVVTESTSPVGAILIPITSLPPCPGSVSNPFW